MQPHLQFFAVCADPGQPRRAARPDFAPSVHRNGWDMTILTPGDGALRLGALPRLAFACILRAARRGPCSAGCLNKRRLFANRPVWLRPRTHGPQQSLRGSACCCACVCMRLAPGRLGAARGGAPRVGTAEWWLLCGPGSWAVGRGRSVCRSGGGLRRPRLAGGPTPHGLRAVRGGFERPQCMGPPHHVLCTHGCAGSGRERNSAVPSRARVLCATTSYLNLLPLGAAGLVLYLFAAAHKQRWCVTAVDR